MLVTQLLYAIILLLTSMKTFVLPLISLFFFSCTTDGVVQEYYDSGELMNEYEMKSGERDGFHKYYSKDGSLILEYMNKDGKRNGEAMAYHSTGEVLKKGMFSNGETIWSEMFDQNGIQLNRYEGNKATFFSYYFDKKLSYIKFVTENYDNINRDSLVSITLDSGYYYSHEPHLALVKVTRHRKLYLVEDLTLNSESEIDTLYSRIDFLHLRNKIIGQDTTVELYKPAIQNKYKPAIQNK